MIEVLTICDYQESADKERGGGEMKKVNKVTLLLRALVSVYVLYLAYGLIKDYVVTCGYRHLCGGRRTDTGPFRL